MSAVAITLVKIVAPLVVIFAVILGIRFAAHHLGGAKDWRRLEFAPGRRLRVTRDVWQSECPWLDRDIGVGTLVYEYLGYTYGVVGKSGIACSFDGGTPAFELPADALEEAPGETDGQSRPGIV